MLAARGIRELGGGGQCEVLGIARVAEDGREPHHEPSINYQEFAKKIVSADVQLQHQSVRDPRHVTSDLAYFLARGIWPRTARLARDYAKGQDWSVCTRYASGNMLASEETFERDLEL